MASEVESNQASCSLSSTFNLPFASIIPVGIIVGHAGVRKLQTHLNESMLLH
jgi:hypothetical protein